jgi:hypothetical protein
MDLTLNEAIKTQQELAKVGEFFNIFQESKERNQIFYLLPACPKTYTPFSNIRSV